MKKLALYYVAWVLVIVIVALLAPRAVVLHPFSLVPAICLVCLLFCTSKWYFTKGGRRTPDMDFKYVKIEGEKGYFQETAERRVSPFDKHERRIWLAARLFAPVFFPFIVFVSPVQKIWSLLFPFLFGGVVLTVDIVNLHREAKKALIRREKARREQEKREEMGRWK